MEIFIKANVDRVEGRQMSTDLVGDELASTIEGESLQVEDSEFEVTSAEAVAGPKQASANPGAVMLLVDDVLREYSKAHPIVFDGPADTERTDLERAIERLLISSDVGELIRQAKVDAHKRAQKVQRVR